MPGVFHLSVDEKLDREVDTIRSLGIPALILFGIPAGKDESGTENYSDDGIVQRALRRLRDRHPDLLLITDVCCCEYTSHGHCGVIRDGSSMLRAARPSSDSSAPWLNPPNSWIAGVSS
jgi:porphobilinogen synthase